MTVRQWIGLVMLVIGIGLVIFYASHMHKGWGTEPPSARKGY